MADSIKFIYGTEAQILALTPSDAQWIDRAFYYPEDKDYFFQALNGVMKMYAGGADFGIGAKINGKVIGAVKCYILDTELLEIPENYQYNIFGLTNDGSIINEGEINLM